MSRAFGAAGDKNMNFYLWGGGGGPGRPLHNNIHGYRGTKMSANAGLITVETYVQAKTSFSYMCQNVIFGYLRGPEGP